MEIFKLVGSIFVDNEKANESLQKTDKKASGVGSTLLSGVKTAAKWGTAIVGAASTAAAGVATLVTETAATADNIDKMSQKIGISNQSYQEWDYIMGQCGANVDMLQTGVKTLVTKMEAAANGNEAATATFDALGLSIYDADGALKDQETMLSEAITALADMGDTTDRASLATTLFGKAGTELAPMLNAGSDAIDDLRQNAHDLNLIMSDEAVSSGVKMTDTIDNIKKSFSAMTDRIGANVMPIVQSLLDFVIDNLPLVQSLFDKLEPVITQLLEKMLPPLMDLISEILPIIIDLIAELIPPIVEIAEAIFPILIELIKTLLPPLMDIIKAVLPILISLVKMFIPIINALLPIIEPILKILSAVLIPVIELISKLLEPVIEVIAVIAEKVAEFLAPALTKLAELLSEKLSAAMEKIQPIIDGVKEKFQVFIDFIKRIFDTDWKEVWDNATDTFKKIFNKIPEIAENVINGAIKLINKLIGGINNVSSKVGIPAIPEIETVKLPRMAKGGVIEQAGSAIVGEDGAEMINLPRGASVTPLNGNNDPLSRQINDLIEETKTQNELLRNMLEALLTGQSISINQREFARLVRSVSNA